MPSLLAPSFSHAQLDARRCWLRLACVRELKCGSNVISNGPRPIVSRLIRIITCATFYTVWKLFNVNPPIPLPCQSSATRVYDWNSLIHPNVRFLCFDLPVNHWGHILSPFMDDTDLNSTVSVVTPALRCNMDKLNKSSEGIYFSLSQLSHGWIFR